MNINDEERQVDDLRTKDLTIGYDKDIVKNITVSVKAGNIVALIGPNGSGKSTLLKTVTGQLPARAGVVMIGDKDRDDMHIKEIASKLSMVMTESIRPELMTCRRVIESGRYPYTGMFGRLSDEDHMKVNEAIAFTETEDIAEKLFTNISDGQRQRVLLARSICQEPKVLVLDEPTSYLDIRYKIDILTRIRKLATDKGVAVLMSIHEPEVAMRLADVVVAVGDGQVMRIGSPREVFEEGFIRKLYRLGDMNMDMIGNRPWF
ncbi:MAG: ABC transporter ATP-binding protein [Lachnospiraceae bacterium]|nr:ABC transporter ATP-binding protein [Lachnospiraceae bacterium]